MVLKNVVCALEKTAFYYCWTECSVFLVGLLGLKYSLKQIFSYPF